MIVLDNINFRNNKFVGAVGDELDRFVPSPIYFARFASFADKNLPRHAEFASAFGSRNEFGMTQRLLSSGEDDAKAFAWRRGRRPER